MSSLAHDQFRSLVISDPDPSSRAPLEVHGSWGGGKYHPSVHDVLTVKDILLGFTANLPLEIVDAIIDEAEYWPRNVCQSFTLARVAGGVGPDESRLVV